MRPSLPRYSFIWDVSIVLNYLRICGRNRDLNLYLLGAKLVTLIALVTGHRCQTFHALDISDMVLTSYKATFYIKKLLKHSNQKNRNTTISLDAYNNDPNICVLRCLKHYIKRTKHLRASSQLFISSLAPHGGVSKETISRWIKLILKKAGIDTSVFKAHSTRAAASSAAFNYVDINSILKTASWTRESTFSKFYCKQPSSQSYAQHFASGVLKS